MKKLSTSSVIIVGIIAVIAILFSLRYWNSSAPASGQYTAFAQCLKDKGATFYGAFWCPHCQSQKKLFGDAVKLLPYVECSTPDGNGETDICKQKNITGYPTWEFADGSRVGGEMTLKDLSDKTTCLLP